MVKIQCLTSNYEPLLPCFLDNILVMQCCLKLTTINHRGKLGFGFQARALLTCWIWKSMSSESFSSVQSSFSTNSAIELSCVSSGTPWMHKLFRLALDSKSFNLSSSVCKSCTTCWMTASAPAPYVSASSILVAISSIFAFCSCMTCILAISCLLSFCLKLTSSSLVWFLLWAF